MNKKNKPAKSKKIQRHPDQPTFSVRKVSEGGMGQRYALQLLKEAGIPAEAGHSPYVGESGVRILSLSKKVERRVSRILYGS